MESNFKTLKDKTKANRNGLRLVVTPKGEYIKFPSDKPGQY
jgi:hypothetical protein